MTDAHERTQSTTSSKGHILSADPYLDSHFAARRIRGDSAFCRFSTGLDPPGCRRGRGSYLPLLSQLVMAQGALEAIDLASENVQMIQARTQRSAFACTGTAQVGGNTALPDADDMFDAVWCANVFQYLSDAEPTPPLPPISNTCCAFRNCPSSIAPPG